MNYPALDESSGVVSSRQFKDVLWTHNDDEAPELFAVDEFGFLIRRYVLPEASNSDWEDIAADERGNLYIYDNTSRLEDNHQSFLYILREPNPRTDEEIEDVRKIPVFFPDGGFDTEAVFVWEESAFFITKPWDARRPRIYRLDNLVDGGMAELIGRFPIKAMITGADISPDGKRLALSSYTALFVFESPEPLSLWPEKRPLVCRLNARQVEGITWRGKDLILTNEEREIFLVPRSRWSKQDAPFLKSPPQTVPFIKSTPSLDLPFEYWSVGRWLWAKSKQGPVSIGRLAWNSEGLFLGLRLPESLELAELRRDDRAAVGLVEWFDLGLVYVFLNPDGERPLVYGESDRCIVIGREASGRVFGEARQLGLATVVESRESDPDWLGVAEEGNRLLVTIRPNAPGIRSLEHGRRLGFNALIVGPNIELFSWTPLTLRFSFDSPNFWGLVELKE